MKKAQMKIQQMVFMLLGVTLFFVLVGLLVLGFKFSGLKSSASDLEEENAMLLASKLANSPEFSCGESYGKGIINCVDGDKVMMLKEKINQYNGFWGVENIEIIIIYPNNPHVECNLKNYPNCNIIKLKTGGSGFDASNFITLCRKQATETGFYNKCDLAKLIVRYKKIE